MKCANSSILYKLLESYPKVLYTIRALSHALAYFNSCLNPYLYALLNRNFCVDLIGIIPTCFTHYRQSELLQNTSRTSLPMTKIVSSANTPDEILIKRIVHDEEDDDDEYEISYQEKNRTVNIDASCQVNLLET
jgi:hypothetical protein